MKKIFLSAILLLSAHPSMAQDEAWLLQSELTPERLSASGAVLTGTDSMAWPDGRAVFVTYWLGAGDAVFRCAEIRDGEAASPSCWQRELVAASETTSRPVVRTLSTRRRALPFDPYQPGYGLIPHIWLGVHR